MKSSRSTIRIVLHEEGRYPISRMVPGGYLRSEAGERHGSRVETSTDAFVEGAWDGTYDDMAMDQGVCMGSGGRIRDGELVLAAPSHTLEALYSVRVDDRLVVSNSLPFALVRAGLDLNPAYRCYLIDMRSIMRGLQYVKIIPTLQGVPVQRHFFCNLVIARDLQVRQKRKPPAPVSQPLQTTASI